MENNNIKYEILKKELEEIEIQMDNIDDENSEEFLTLIAYAEEVEQDLSELKKYWN